jgi:hypothetical protein
LNCLREMQGSVSDECINDVYANAYETFMHN